MGEEASENITKCLALRRSEDYCSIYELIEFIRAHSWGSKQQV